MGRHINRLTPRGIAALKEPGIYADGNRLYLRARATGERHDGSGLKMQWVLIYRWGKPGIGRNSNRIEMGLGGYPAISLKIARDKAREANEQLAVGINPLAAKGRANALPTFEEAARELHARDLETVSLLKTANRWLAMLEARVFPIFGAIRIDLVSEDDVEAVLKPIWTEVPEVAKKMRRAISAVMKYAIARRWRKDDPAKHIDALLGPHNHATTHHKALPYAQVAAALENINASDAYTATKLAHQFLAHTGTRSGDVRNAVWSEIKDGVWTIPASRLKMKRLKDKAPHIVTLSPRALAILEEAAMLNPKREGLIFPSLTGKALSDNTLSKIMRDLEIDATPHGYRTSFREFARFARFPDDVAEFAIDHGKRNRIEASYARYRLEDETAKLFAAWSAYLEAGPQAENVIALKRADG